MKEATRTIELDFSLSMEHDTKIKARNLPEFTAFREAEDIGKIYK